MELTIYNGDRSSSIWHSKCKGLGRVLALALWLVQQVFAQNHLYSPYITLYNPFIGGLVVDFYAFNLRLVDISFGLDTVYKSRGTNRINHEIPYTNL